MINTFSAKTAQGSSPAPSSLLPAPAVTADTLADWATRLLVEFQPGQRRAQFTCFCSCGKNLIAGPLTRQELNEIELAWAKAHRGHSRITREEWLKNRLSL